MNEQDPNSPATRQPDVDPDLEVGFYGFIATEPEFHDENGKPHIFFRAGQLHYDYIDGERVKLPTTFHSIVAFEGAAVHGDRKLEKHDVFLAFGRMEDNPHPDTGAPRKRFVVNRFGHDLARMNYEVGTPRRIKDMPQPGRERPGRGQHRGVAFETAEHEQPARESVARAM